MNNLDIPILQKTYELCKLFHQYSEKFPKKDRFTIGQRCENHILILLESVIYASKSAKDNKARLLFEISVKLDTLKILIRLLKEVKTIDLKQYAHLEECVFEIGKMLGGWIKFVH
ncbi:MAG: hypothetical protein UT33_C0011G0136 [Candidatus Peregrinibacteria bacterium GW2011_GWC2_39_14]|nr:MAG: hypothetical protein UT33_C0011G0136 [Candidatus Peregrinibacteria bacterium GW2011_GWC2_39_14]